MPFTQTEALFAAVSDAHHHWLELVLKESVPPQLMAVGEQVDLLLQERRPYENSPERLN